MTDPASLREPALSTGAPPTGAPPTGTPPTGTPRSLSSDAWYDLRRRPLFWVSVSLIAFLLVLALAPGLFTSVDPNAADLARSRQEPSVRAWFGYDLQGRDIYARTVYGTRVSIVVGVLATGITIAIGATMGIIAGYLGGRVDAVVSRVADVFFGLPFVLGAIVALTTLRGFTGDSAAGITALVVATMGALSWPVTMRIMRSAAISARQQDYVRAARGLGAGPGRVIRRHLLPNCLAPVLVYATIALGAFIGAEATLSYLGIGLRDPVVSWGVMISEASSYVRSSPHMVLFPAGFLTVTVLAFVMLGDAVREAFDPKSR